MLHQIPPLALSFSHPGKPAQSRIPSTKRRSSFLLEFHAQTPHDGQPSTSSPARIPRPPLFCRCLGIILRSPCFNASVTLRNSNLSRGHDKEGCPHSVVPLGICDWDCNDRATLSRLARACLCAICPSETGVATHTPQPNPSHYWLAIPPITTPT
ncbi:hypothetical protein COCCADRAFT_107167 [Bipolaris zeicola 26-R-13]|uniref:Uncharacterized protein n=1 Tax=Cochliobolus carbonum (strain 26-R-13) TaxID=930089 RepID=W6XVJ1_COCC2|nr:uncharacterized protein COCCADRAFT_107167 [Bipolaris zeicola 26-R-13]EUC29200.1 hypothetical protein COCCADRAFT_107167 [Bipolaris zeicola 26-R-13]